MNSARTIGRPNDVSLSARNSVLAKFWKSTLTSTGSLRRYGVGAVARGWRPLPANYGRVSRKNTAPDAGFKGNVTWFVCVEPMMTPSNT